MLAIQVGIKELEPLIGRDYKVLMWKGELLHIHTSPAAGLNMESHKSVSLISGSGLEGDRYQRGTGKYSEIEDIREVTLIEIETLEALKRDYNIIVEPTEHRRNLTTRDVPLNHLVGKRFRVGEVLLLGGRLNTPCRYLNLVTKKDICDLLEHRSGLNCSIVESGTVSVGDKIQLL